MLRRKKNGISKVSESKIVPVRNKSELWKKAALIKVENAVSLGDAFAAATAISLNVSLVTGADVEFSKIRNLKLERV